MTDDDDDLRTYPPAPFRNVITASLLTAVTIIVVVLLGVIAAMRVSDNSVKRERSKYEQCRTAADVGDCLYRAQGYRDD